MKNWTIFDISQAGLVWFYLISCPLLFFLPFLYPFLRPHIFMYFILFLEVLLQIQTAIRPMTGTGGFKNYTFINKIWSSSGAKVVLDPNLAVNPVIKTGLNLERKTGLNPVIKTGPNPVRKTRLNPVRKTDLNPLKNVAPNPSPRANPARRNGRDLAAAANPGEKTDLNPEASPNHEASLVIKVNQEAGLDPVTSDRIFN